MQDCSSRGSGFGESQGKDRILSRSRSFSTERYERGPHKHTILKHGSLKALTAVCPAEPHTLTSQCAACRYLLHYFLTHVPCPSLTSSLAGPSAGQKQELLLQAASLALGVCSGLPRRVCIKDCYFLRRWGLLKPCCELESRLEASRGSGLGVES